jgi:hypothetical protein
VLQRTTFGERKVNDVLAAFSLPAFVHAVLGTLATASDTFRYHPDPLDSACVPRGPSLLAVARKTAGVIRILKLLLAVNVCIEMHWDVFGDRRSTAEISLRAKKNE